MVGLGVASFWPLRVRVYGCRVVEFSGGLKCREALGALRSIRRYRTRTFTMVLHSSGLGCAHRNFCSAVLLRGDEW